MAHDMVKLGLAGYGTVGTGLARILEENGDWIARRLGKRLGITKVLVRNLDKGRAFPPGPKTTFTTSMEELVNDPEIDIVVELMGGIEAPYQLIRSALEKGKPVVTANKALLAERGPELFALANRQGLGLYYEASVAGGIPIVETLKQSLAGNKIKTLTGILNGTANFILSEMTATGMDFTDALGLAQDKGYAEADPELDIEGMDAAHKLCLLIRLAHGQDYPLHDLPVQGITGMHPFDIEMARDFGYRIKLLAQVKDRSGHLQAGVFPALIKEDHILAKVDGPYNAILLDGNAVGPIMLYGQGAGDLPTGSAVLADIMALARKTAPNNTGFIEESLPKAQILAPEQTVFRHYFRFTVKDRPGVLSTISGIMGERNISIAQAVQKQEPQGGGVPVVFFSHAAQLKDVRDALSEIDGLSFVCAPTVHYRILS